LKRLKPDAKKDNLDHLITSAAAFGRLDVVRYLLELGAKPNDKANGGSSSLDRCLLTSLGFRGFRYDSYFGSPAKVSKYSVSNTLDMLRLLFEQGAQWRPDEPREIQWVRRNLLECEPDVAPVARKFGLMGFDIRTKEQKAEDERRADEYRRWTIRQLASKYDRQKIYEEIWSDRCSTLPKDTICPMLD
jgi:ankyrin repeat protein